MANSMANSTVLRIKQHTRTRRLSRDTPHHFPFLRATSGNVNGETERDAGRREKRKPPVLEASASDPAFILKDENNNNNKKKSASSLLELESESSRYTSTSSKGGEKKKKVSKVEEATSRQSLRTQLTSGIQATTSTLDLPEPQVAVRNLMEYARHAHMSTVMSKAQHRRADYPFGSIVEFAVDGSGHPVFAMSSLAIHTRNVLSNPRCAIQIQAPGWTGLNNARVTLFGDVFPVDPGSAQDASDLFTAKREKMGAGQNSKKNNLSFNNNKGANMRYFVMSNLVDILFVGGYGTVKWIKPKDYHEAEPDFILQDLANTIKTCNELFGEAIKVEIPEADDVSFISVDKRGVELRVREGIEDSVRRLRFTENCFTRQDVCEQLRELIKG